MKEMRMTPYIPSTPIREDEQFWSTSETPSVSAWGKDWLFRRVAWKAHDWYFISYILLWFIRWYYGTGKIDATQSFRAQSEGQYAWIVTTTPRELWSFRIRWRSPDRERVTNMGGI